MIGATRRRAPDAGVTMVELMISLLLSALATALAFSLYVTASRAQRTQGRVSEAQQTVRAAGELLTRDIRQAGLGARSFRTAMGGAPLVDVLPLRIVNDAYGEGPDQITVMYADLSAQGRVVAPGHTATETHVENAAGFAVGNVIVASRANPMSPGTFGHACVLEITGIGGAPGDYTIAHDPGGAGWNAGTNEQCDYLTGWVDGYTTIYPFVMRAYRIKEDDPRGVLQLSPSGGFINDWTDIAVGVIDMQVAMQVHEPADAVDVDLDGNAEYDWYSGAAMATVLTVVPNAVPVRVRVSLLAKASAPAGSPQLDQTPDFFQAGAPLANNEMGDRPGTVLPVVDMASPYYGDNVYRWTSTVIDVRNLGVGL